MTSIEMNCEKLFGLLDLTSQPRQAVREARGWLLDCFDDEDAFEEITTMNAIRIVQSIETHYEGGFRQFLVDALLIDHCPICHGAGEHALSCPTRWEV